MRDDSVTRGLVSKPAVRVRALALVLGLAAAAAVHAQAPAGAAAPKAVAAKAARQPAGPIIEQRAVDLLRAASDRLAAAKSMRFTAIASYEYPSRLGPPILYTMRYDVALQRPNQLRIVVPGDGPATEFFWDGKEVIAFAPNENLVAVASAPPTLEGVFRQAQQNAQIYFPFADLLLPDPYAVISHGAVLAFGVGPSVVVGGVKTDMIVWASKEVFMQLWIGAEDKLPRRIRAIYRNDPRGLRHDLELSNWQIDGTIPAEHFATDKARAGQPMKFAVPGPARPVPKGKAAAPKPAPKTQ
jgi:hypothetical protein